MALMQIWPISIADSAKPPPPHTPRDGISPFLTCIQINPSAILVQEFCISAISA